MNWETRRLVRFYVGGAASGSKVREADWKAITLFGGFTRLDGWGGWEPAMGPSTQEPPSVWEIYPPDSDHEEKDVEEFATFLKELFQQEAVLVSVVGAAVTLV